MTFSISALVLARDSHIKPDNEVEKRGEEETKSMPHAPVKEPYVRARREPVVTTV